MLIQKLARVHKDDVFAVKPARPKRPKARTRAATTTRRPSGEAAGSQAAPKPSTEVLKWFFAAVSVGVALTTLLRPVDGARLQPPEG